MKEDFIWHRQEKICGAESCGKATINFVFDRYMSLKNNLKPTTKSNYLYMYDRFIRETFGKRNIAEIKYSDVVQFYNHLIEKQELKIPTMKSLDGVNKKNDVNNTASEAAEKNVKTESEKIDFSKVKIEPLFEEMVDFDTFSKSDFRAVKVKECVAVPKSKKLLQFTLDDGTGTDRTIEIDVNERAVLSNRKTAFSFTPTPIVSLTSCGGRKTCIEYIVHLSKLLRQLFL